MYLTPTTHTLTRPPRLTVLTPLLWPHHALPHHPTPPPMHPPIFQKAILPHLTSSLHSPSSPRSSHQNHWQAGRRHLLLHLPPLLTQPPPPPRARPTRTRTVPNSTLIPNEAPLNAHFTDTSNQLSLAVQTSCTWLHLGLSFLLPCYPSLLPASHKILQGHLPSHSSQLLKTLPMVT